MDAMIIAVIVLRLSMLVVSFATADTSTMLLLLSSPYKVCQAIDMSMGIIACRQLASEMFFIVE